MDSSDSIRKLRECLSRIDAILEWADKSGKFHHIDRDTLLENARNLYSLILDLEPEGAFPIAPPPVTREAPKVEEPVAQPAEPVFPPSLDPGPEPQWEPLLETAPEPELPPASKPIPEPVVEPVREPIRETSIETIRETVIERVIESEPEPVLFPRKPAKSSVREAKTLAEAIVTQRDDSLNELLGKQNPVQDLASAITETPVTDIWAAITFNERFRFVRDLFDNDAEHFKRTVQHLNGLDSWESAKAHVSGNFRWTAENEVAIDFLNVVRRRFLK